MKISMEIDSTETWISRVKENKIANKLISRLGFDYDYWLLNDDPLSLKHNHEDVSKLHDSLIPQTLDEHKIDTDFLSCKEKYTNGTATTEEQNKKKKNKKKKKKKKN